MTTPPNPLTALAERVEKLTGPCRETDARIAIAVDARPDWLKGDDRPLIAGIQGTGHISAGKHGPGFAALDYTRSLDCAMTLLPPNHRWVMNGPAVDGAGDDIKPCAAVMPYGVSLFLPQDTHQAATPVLAFLSAVLRARAASEFSHG